MRLGPEFPLLGDILGLLCLVEYKEGGYLVPFEEEHLPRSTILGVLGSILSSTWTDFFPEQGHFRPGISHFELILLHFVVVVVVLVVMLVLGEGILIMPTPIEPDGFACSKPVRLLQLASDEVVGVAWKDLTR